MTSQQLKSALKGQAKGLGFARFGVAKAGRVEPEATHLKRWLADGFHGDLEWMERTSEVRSDVRHPGMLPSAESVIVLATPYVSARTAKGPSPGRIARYAQGRDYHNVLYKRLKPMVRRLREEGFEARASVDSLPVFERAWAERAGVGFVGKNACLIVPGLGSHVFLSAIVTSARMTPDEPMAPRCGSCRLCLDRCPTDAFAGPGRLDARRCVSYLTIEAKGPIPMELRGGVGEWLFGCDDCQDVCPFNARPLGQVGDPSSPFAAKPQWSELAAEDWLRMTDDEFEQLTPGSPLRRGGRAGLARNAAIVLGNRGSRRHLRVLEATAESHPSEVVREAASWAAQRCTLADD